MRGDSAPNRVTCAESHFHFLRQLNGKPHLAQIFDGRSDFLRIFMGDDCTLSD